MPQYAIQRLYELSKGRDTYIPTAVRQHQMSAAQFFGFEEPNHWLTSGGLGTMGDCLPAAIGVQDRNSGMSGQKVYVRVDLGGRSSIQKKQSMTTCTT